MKKILLLGIIAVILCGCDVVDDVREIKKICEPPSIHPRQVNVQEYNPKKAGAEIVARYEAVAGDNAVIDNDRLYVVGSSNALCHACIYDVSHSEMVFLNDLTFDIANVMPNYRCKSCKCIIPNSDKLLMLMSLDGTTDCNVFVSLNLSDGGLAIMDVSNDISDLDNVYEATYITTEHKLKLYYLYTIYPSSRLMLCEYVFDEIEHRFTLCDFSPVRNIFKQNGAYQWIWSSERCGYTEEGDWLICSSIIITPLDNPQITYQIYTSYLDLSVNYSFITLFSLGGDDVYNNMVLYVKQSKLNQYEFVKLRLIE